MNGSMHNHALIHVHAISQSIKRQSYSCICNERIRDS